MVSTPVKVTFRPYVRWDRPDPTLWGLEPEDIVRLAYTQPELRTYAGIMRACTDAQCPDWRNPRNSEVVAWWHFHPEVPT